MQAEVIRRPSRAGRARWRLRAACASLLATAAVAGVTLARPAVQPKRVLGPREALAELLRRPQPGPNPYLSFLPAGAQPDWAYWRQRLALEAEVRRLDREVARQVPPVQVTESEPAGSLWHNDLPVHGEPVAGFGTAAGLSSAAELRGHLRPIPHPAGTAAEADDSIPQATVVAILPGETVVVAGEIGDGAHGSGGAVPSGDFDFLAVAGGEGERLEVLVRTPEPLAGLDPVLAVYDASGAVLAFNDDLPLPGFLVNLDCWVELTLPATGLALVAVGGYHSGSEPDDMLPADPFDPASGPGAGSEGAYEVIIGRAVPTHEDVDVFALELRAGDVVGATVTGCASQVRLHTLEDERLVASTGGDLSAIYPAASPLPGGGVATVAWVVDAVGTYGLGLSRPPFYCYGEYLTEVEVFRSPLAASPTPTRQVLYVDFDGAAVDPAIFGAPPGQVQLSPLAAFLSRWGLQASDEAALIDAVLGVVEENLSADVRLAGANGDHAATGLLGEFDIEIRNSRDHPDPWGEPLVSRVIVGGTVDELGLVTIGIAQSVDVGNFEAAETAVVLLDLLSGAEEAPDSLNGIQLAAGVTRLELVGLAVGNIVAHEAGHLFANFHTERDQGPETLMDRGGRLGNIIGSGEDEVFGSADDVDIDLGPDTYEPAEAFTGTEHTLQTVSFDLGVGGPRPDVTVSPFGRDFGAVAPGGAASAPFTIGNVGSLQLSVSATPLEGSGAGEFAIVAGGGAFTLPPGGTRDIAVEFGPEGLGSSSAVLAVLSDDPDAPRLELPISGQGGVPQAAVSPAAHDFGEVVYGDAGVTVTRIVTIANGGPGSLVVEALAMTGPDPGVFAIDDATAPLEVAAGELRAVTVSFRPGGLVGCREGILAVGTNDPTARRVDVALVGCAQGPDVDIDFWPAFHFGPVPLGSSAWRWFQVRNLGSRDLEVTETSISGEHADDFDVAAGGAPFTVPAGGAHNLQIVASPSERDDREALLTLRSNDPDEGVLELELAAVGVAPEILVTPETWDFGGVAVGSASERRFRITNQGDSGLSGSATLVGPHADQFAISGGPDTFGLLPGAGISVWVEFRPSRAGWAQGALEIVSNDPVRPVVEVPMSGEGLLQSPAVPALSVVGLVLFAGLLLGAGLLLARRRD